MYFTTLETVFGMLNFFCTTSQKKKSHNCQNISGNTVIEDVFNIKEKTSTFYDTYF